MLGRSDDRLSDELRDQYYGCVFKAMFVLLRVMMLDFADIVQDTGSEAQEVHP